MGSRTRNRARALDQRKKPNESVIDYLNRKRNAPQPTPEQRRLMQKVLHPRKRR